MRRPIGKLAQSRCPAIARRFRDFFVLDRSKVGNHDAHFTTLPACLQGERDLRLKQRTSLCYAALPVITFPLDDCALSLIAILPLDVVLSFGTKAGKLRVDYAHNLGRIAGLPVCSYLYLQVDALLSLVNLLSSILSKSNDCILSPTNSRRIAIAVSRYNWFVKF